MKILNEIFNSILLICVVILFLPIVLVIIIVVGPFVYLSNYSNKVSNQRKLKKQLEKYNGVIFFLCSDYNNFDFFDYFKEKPSKVMCFKVKKYNNDAFINYLKGDCKAHCYPKLVKIQDDTLIEKNHYTAFKHFYKDKGDIDSFYDLVEKSIKNLENEKRNTT